MSSLAALLTTEMLRSEGARHPSWVPWIGSGALRHSLLLKPLACREVNLHVPPPPPATFGGSKLHPSHLQIRTSQLLSPAVLCEDSLDSAEIKANDKK